MLDPPTLTSSALGQTLPTVAAEAAKRWEELNIRVAGGQAPAAQEPLRLRFMTMPRQAQAALLRLDPLVDRGDVRPVPAT